ncbi:C4-dicarboxylic acid transporter DauA [Thioflexithrix psekupsensis]|uniref:C4-dicarboxylic acid transporter DauA n=1 Tax=Thioflexithrix psekupsensis TaxID=1570016 RepID=A0A251XA82_9GAMM|nr:C4-dicarboxylic acid transporter DauA [Thioflexithrix psekupsensis]OUD15342.1 C4-dicarboxylic acid transporter DauA [Thioflexithrix psekupsensis]
MTRSHNSPLEEHKPQFASALRESFQQGYRLNHLHNDVLSGITVGIIAIPLSMALAIATGVPPQHGLYTAIVAGIIIALAGGSRVNISGPTAAFVVILLPIVHEYGLGGLLIASIMAGIMLIIMGLARMGKLMEYIPYTVIMGFTAGIGVVIATIQVKDFLGLTVENLQGHYTEKLMSLIAALPSFRIEDFLIGCLTLFVLLTWSRITTKIPSHLVALIAGTLAALLFGTIWTDFDVATIGSRFEYDVNGQQGTGIPPLPPFFVLPWNLPDANGQPIGLSFELIRNLLGPAFAIAMLGAIESLLCAVVADGIAGTRHNPNTELVSQGLGNVVAPFFGGIPATAAIARTAANIRAGGRSPISAIVHSLVILLAVVSLAEWFSYVPMAALAALLFIVAWNMSEAKHFMRLVRTAPRGDVAVLLTCFSLTVLFDMVLAVGAGLILASLLFIRRMAELTGTELLSTHEHEHLKNLPEQISVYEINGPLFFGAAEKAVKTLHQIDPNVKVLIIDMTDVPMIDMTGIVALESLLDNLFRNRMGVVISNLQPRILEKLKRAGISEQPGRLLFGASLPESADKAKLLLSTLSS